MLMVEESLTASFKYIPIIHLLITSPLADKPLFGPGGESRYPGIDELAKCSF